MNIIQVIEQTGHHLDRKAGTHGGEYAGACPFCGGKDRFRVWIEQNRYWCRQCNKHGDTIQFIRDTKGMSYKDACAYLDLDPKDYSLHTKSEYVKPVWIPKQIKEPGDIWQEKARAFLTYTQKNLKSKACSEIRKWLHARGLLNETIDKAGLGWNSRDYYRDRKTWGLETKINEETGKEKRLWLPKGLVIPYIVDNRIIRLRIRRPKKEDDPRYYFIPGGDPRAMVWNHGRISISVSVIVESELDGILINQESGDLVKTIALGNAQIRPDIISHEILEKSELILCCLDSDSAGVKESWSFWKDTYPQFKRWTCLGAKDPTEMYQNKEYRIREWIVAGFNGDRRLAIKEFPKEWKEKYDDATLEKLAGLTINGKLSDVDALQACGLL